MDAGLRGESQRAEPLDGVLTWEMSAWELREIEAGVLMKEERVSMS